MTGFIRDSGFLLNDYTISEKRIISVDGVEYEVTLFQGNHSNEYLLSEMKAGQIEGRCQLFNRGVLSVSWMMKNGKQIGGITKYENGKVIEKVKWDSLNGDGDCRVIENNSEGLIMTIRRENNGKDENEVVIYRGGFDEEMNRNGYGIEYDSENGKERFEGYWKNDQLKKLLREFDAENHKMIEYDENSGIDILSRIPIYMGGYSIVNGEFVRNGRGYLIDEKSGTAKSESEWCNGIEKNKGAMLYEGWYVEGMKESIRSVLNNESPSEMKSDPIVTASDKPINIHTTQESNEELCVEEGRNEKSERVVNGEDRSETKSEPIMNVPEKQIQIRESSELNEMDLDVTELIICSNSCNDVKELDLSKFKWLQSIEIGDDCFESVQTFKIDGLNRLKSLTIGKNSFTQEKNGYRNNKAKSFHILNCDSLEQIEMGQYSMSDFGGGFELYNLNSLKSMRIGEIGCNSFNFFYSSFVIRGNELLKRK